MRADPREATVSPLELFFDLVFVFALTQVTAFLADDPTFAQLGRGMVVLALIWWAWSGYTWLTSTVDPELVLPRLVLFAAMAAMLVVALATPGAFEDDGVIWGLGYLAVRLLHAALFALAARGDPALARAVLSLVVSLIPGAGLVILASAAFEGTTRDLLWVAAVILDYGIVLSRGVEGWHVHARHFAERFGLVLIIALGESIVAIGVGAEGVELTGEVVLAALLGIGIVCALWWAYFDVVAVVAEHRFTEATGIEQVRMARDSYALLHLPMIAGIVLFALGVKKVLEHTGDPLKDMPAVALCGGLALYLLAHIAFRLRNVGSLNRPRLVAAAVCLALIPLATAIAGVAMLGDPARGLRRADELRGRALRRGARPHPRRPHRALAVRRERRPPGGPLRCVCRVVAHSRTAVEPPSGGPRAGVAAVRERTRGGGARPARGVRDGWRGRGRQDPARHRARRARRGGRGDRPGRRLRRRRVRQAAARAVRRGAAQPCARARLHPPRAACWRPAARNWPLVLDLVEPPRGDRAGAQRLRAGTPVRARPRPAWGAWRPTGRCSSRSRICTGPTARRATSSLPGHQPAQRAARVLATYRADDLHRGHPLRPLVAELERAGWAERLHLRPFTRAEVAEQIAGILGEPPTPAFVAEVFERAEGNAFCVEQLVATAREGGGRRLPILLRGHPARPLRAAQLAGPAAAAASSPPAVRACARS